MRKGQGAKIGLLGGLKVVVWGIVAACSSSSGGGGAPAASGSAQLTYYKDVKPIVDAKCAQCHTAGGIAPFALAGPQDVLTNRAAIVFATEARTMPPWPPGQGCTEYLGDRSLTDAQIATIRDWDKSGAPLGDPADFKPLAEAPAPTMSRVDVKLPIASAPYTPVLRPDEYRCFLIDWSEATTKFITGFGATPGQASIVHHVLSYVISPDQAATYAGYDAADPGPGYTCFGGPTPSDVQQPSLPTLFGGWAPGSLGQDFPAGTGVRVEPGSKLVVQVHYNTTNAPPVPDQTSISLELASSVDKEAVLVPFTNPAWVKQHTMSIPAGAPDTAYSFAYDAVTAVSAASHGKIAAGQPFTAYSAHLHMHLHGTHTSFTLERQSGANECMLDIARWNFHWQGGYDFAKPKIVAPGDKLNLECHWDNTPGNQPTDANGTPMPTKDLNWGEGTTDEMCLGFLYVTQ